MKTKFKLFELSKINVDDCLKKQFSDEEDFQISNTPLNRTLKLNSNLFSFDDNDIIYKKPSDDIQSKINNNNSL